MTVCVCVSGREFLSCLCPGPGGPSWRQKRAGGSGEAVRGISDANIPVNLGSSPGLHMNYADSVQTQCVEGPRDAPPASS